MQKAKRWLALLLSVVMLTTALPITALAKKSPPADEVTYNTGFTEITVTEDATKLGEPFYYVFDEDGDHTIEITEPDPFFPYEVQFTCNGVTESRWFETPEDTEALVPSELRLPATFPFSTMPLRI